MKLTHDEQRITVENRAEMVEALQRVAESCQSTVIKCGTLTYRFPADLDAEWVDSKKLKRLKRFKKLINRIKRLPIGYFKV